MDPLRILVVDDHVDVRNGIRSLLSSRSGLEVCGEAADGIEAIQKAHQLRPDVILMDISMPRMDGFHATRVIRSEIPECQIIIVTQNDPAVVRKLGPQIGAHAYVSKVDLSRDLFPALSRIANRRVDSKPVSVESADPTGDQARKRLEPQLRESERHLRDLIDALPAAIYTTDAHGYLTHFNHAAIRLAGRMPEIGKDRWCVTWKLYLPDGSPLPHDQCPMAAAVRDGTVIDGTEVIAVRPDGTRVWFTSYPRPLRNDDGQTIGGINMLVDITERKHTETATAHLAAIVGSSDDAIISKNLHGIITSWNSSAERLFGYSANEAIGQNIRLIIPPARWPEEAEILARLRRGERIDHFETVRRRKNGSTLDISLTVSPLRDSANRVIGASKVARDITERKRAEKKLADTARQQRALFRLADGLHRAATLDEIYDAAMNAICSALECERASILLTDSRETMRFVSWRGLSEESRHAIEGRSPWPPGTRNSQPILIEDVETADLDDALKTVVRAEGIGALAFIPLTSDGYLIGTLVLYFAEPHTLTGEQFDLSLAIARQLAFAIDRKRSEEALRASEERFRSLSARLDADVQARTRELEERTHQLRDLSWQLLRIQDNERRHIARELHDSAGQKLTVLGMNLAQIVNSARESTPELAEQAQKAQELVQQLSQEIRTTSYLLHPPLLDETGLPAALGWYVEGLRGRSDLDIRLTIAPDFGRLTRDMELVIFRLVQECLTNIHRHSGSSSADIRLSHDAQRITVEVSDQGCGISADVLQTIQTSGSGVGLRGMRERIFQFGGEMSIQSNGNGTMISAILPAKRSAPTEPTLVLEQTRAAG